MNLSVAAFIQKQFHLWNQAALFLFKEACKEKPEQESGSSFPG